MAAMLNGNKTLDEWRQKKLRRNCNWNFNVNVCTSRNLKYFHFAIGLNSLTVVVSETNVLFRVEKTRHGWKFGLEIIGWARRRWKRFWRSFWLREGGGQGQSLLVLWILVVRHYGGVGQVPGCGQQRDDELHDSVSVQPGDHFDFTIVRLYWSDTYLILLLGLFKKTYRPHLLDASRSTFHSAGSVTTWLDYFFNIWPFTTRKLSPRA